MVPIYEVKNKFVKQDLVSRNIFDSTDTFQVETLQFSFSGLLQEELNFVMEYWNTHSIRKSRFGTVSGSSDALYYPTLQNLLVEHQM